MLLRDSIYAALRADILACRLAPGEEIKELKLASVYEVSRAPVRDALVRLEQEGLVKVRSRQGYQVNPVSVADARDLFQYRAVLEMACATAAAKHATAEQLDDLRKIATFHVGDDFVGYNRSFHAALAALSGNKRLEAAGCDVIDQAERMVHISLATIKSQDPMELVSEHHAIVEAICARESRKASCLVRDHVKSAESRVLKGLLNSAIVP